FSLWGMVRSFRTDEPHATLYRTISLIVVAHWLMISTISPRAWWAGWSFGPRNFMDALALWVVLLVPALDGLAELSPRTTALVAPIGGAALAWSLFAAVHGALSPAPIYWNSMPIPVEERPERLWDWHDMQILRGVL